jgi:hypothetical protein
MGLRGDDRGQAVQVGAVLLLAVFVVTLSLYQATVIPNENKQVEFNDYQDATADLADLRNAILRSATEDAQTGATVKTGSHYPARSLFVNPPPARGRLASSLAANVTIANVETAGSRENVGKYLTSEGNALNVSTRSVVFDPAYSELDVAPLVTGYGTTYRAYDDPIVLTDQTLVRGNRITLVSVAGELRAEGHTAPLTVEPVSAHTRTISITGDSGPVNLTIPTELTAAVWEDRLLAGQMAPAGNVLEVTPGPRPNTVNVSLAGDETYELRLGQVEVHGKSDASEADAPDARYLVAKTDTDTRTDGDGRVALTVETRDPYNNPVSSTNVTFNQSSGSGSFETKAGDPVSFPIKTDEDGGATVYFNATGHLGTIPVDAWLGTSDPPEDEKDVRFSVFNNVLEGDDGGGSSGEQAGRNLVILEDISGISGANDDDLQLTINNTGSFNVNVTGYRLDYVTGIRPNGNLVEGPTAITQMVFDGSKTRTGDAFEGSRPYFFSGDRVQLSPNSHTVDVTFNSAFGWDPDAQKNQNIQGVFIGFSIYIEGEITVTYTVHVIL